MSYQVLARKWRPQTFQQVIGQPHVLTALENGLSQDRVHHAYLFSGTRGVGKTTIARIFAKSLNCEIGVTATPCGQCANCEAIDQGRFVDLLEIDAASRTKVDDTRELLDNVQYKPAQGRYKVYLIDEVHMLSKHSFNALLKTLEEPPEYVKFLLATTDPQKLPITVLSRCLQFHLKAILPDQIEQQLADILGHENASFEQGALGVIAKAADGSMRDALSLTDQALAFGAGNIQYAAVLKMLGTIDQSHLHYLLHFIASGNSQKVFEKIQEFVHLGADFSALHQELASLCHQIALMQLQLNANVTEKTAVQLLAERLTPEEVQLFYQIALQGYKDYAFAPNGKVALEMTVMRLLAFKPANYVDIDESMLTRAQQVETVVADVSPASLVQPAVNQVAPQIEVTAPVRPVNTVIQTQEQQPSAPIISETVHTAPVNVTEASPAVTSVIAPSVAEQSIVEQSHVLPTTSPAVDAMPAEPSSLHVEVNSNLVTAHEPITQTQPDNHPPVEHQTIWQPPVTEPVVEQQPAQAQSIQPVNTPVPETTAPTPETTTVGTASLTSSNSRNMLRSHRLKREELKKTEAVVDPLAQMNGQSTAPVIETANTPISATVADSPLNTAPLNKGEPQFKPAEPSSTFDKQPVDKNINTGQELPPLSSYQDNSNHQNVSDYDAGPHSFNQPQNEQHYSAQDAAPEKPTNERNVHAYQQETISAPVLNVENQVETTGHIQPVAPVVIANNDISALQQGNNQATEIMLIDNGSFERVEVDVATYVDDKMTDSWFLAIKAMQLVGFEKLLAKSTVMQQNGQQITLTLHEPQQHLLNNQRLCEDLKMKLRHYYGQDCNVTIEAGKVEDSHTPMELELIVYQQYLDNAKSSIKNDLIVQTLVRDYSAKVYENSVVPL